MSLHEKHPLLHLQLQAPAPSNTIQANVNLLIDRERVGVDKYGTTLDRTDLTHSQMLQHFLEEMLDGANYAQAALRSVGEDAADYRILRQRMHNLLIRLEIKATYGRIDILDELSQALFQDDADRVLRNGR